MSSQLLSGHRLFLNHHDYQLNRLIVQPYLLTGGAIICLETKFPFLNPFLKSYINVVKSQTHCSPYHTQWYIRTYIHA